MIDYYDRGEYCVKYRCHDNGARIIVEEILGYCESDGTPIAKEELEERLLASKRV